MFWKKSEFSPSELRVMADAVRFLALDAVQTAQSGHPGVALGFADVVATLYANHLNFDPAIPDWSERDIVILSAGHASAMLYSVLHLAGYRVSRDDLKKFRKLGGLPGHPEMDVGRGIEMTTGPLGQGFASAVGLAMARPNNKIYVLASDGDLMEGLTMEAASLAGFKKLRNLIVLWDDNGITIDGQAATIDDIPEKFRSMGWNTIELDGNDTNEIGRGLRIAKRMKAPVLIACKTEIGIGSKNSGTEKVHGSPLEYDDALALLSKLSLSFEKGSGLWKKLSDSKRNASHKSEPKRQVNWFDVPRPQSPKNSTRELFSVAINSAALRNPEVIIGGSADLSHSTGSLTPAQNYIHYGVREHAMAAVMNGLALGGFYPYGGTFLVFSDYMRPAIRLTALMKLPVLFVFSHDSIAIGEDGPTHQPIEQLPALRMIPNLTVLRPCNNTEIFLSLRRHFDSGMPTAIILSRQSFVNPPENADANLDGYVIFGSKKAPVKLVATGSEVALAIEICQELAGHNITACVISVPNIKMAEKLGLDGFVVWIEASAQPAPIRADLTVNIAEFGKSGSGADVYKSYGFDAKAISKKIQEKL